jgi:isopentenyl-diphosphate delta-isomerase
MAPQNAVWDGNAMSQEDMMMKDTVLVLDDEDNVIGSASKRKSHEFTKEQPRAILHRAFSAFIFDESTGELLLQQRASSKITFPNVRSRQTYRHCFADSCIALRYSPTDGMDGIENHSQATTASHPINLSHYFLVRY